MLSIKNETKTNRNCLVGKGLQIKICDFGTDSDIYGLDYYRSEDQTLGLPVRWMAWESVIQVYQISTWNNPKCFGVSISVQKKYNGLPGQLFTNFLKWSNSRGNIRPKVTCGRLPSLCGRFWFSLDSVLIKNSVTRPSSKICSVSHKGQFQAPRRVFLCRDRSIALAISTTWCANAGGDCPPNVLPFVKFIFSSSARTLAILPLLRILFNRIHKKILYILRRSVYHLFLFINTYTTLLLILAYQQRHKFLVRNVTVASAVICSNYESTTDYLCINLYCIYVYRTFNC